MDKPPVSVKAIFDQALEIISPVERAAYLDQTCAASPELRAKVEALLQAYADAGSFLEKPAPVATVDSSPGPSPVPAAARAPLPEGPGGWIGSYKLLQKLGEGGMGTVWVAEQTEPVKRRVALKVIKPGMDSAQVLRRFEAERQALALMDHTHIAKVFDAGTTPEGRPYFVMELVRGAPMTKYCDELHLPIRERLDLFVPVCQAIQHAHQKGIIHRDIKPSNVLVAIQDGKPVAKVIDFGVAKAVHQRLTEESVYTEIGQVIGTLEYMSPEQAELSVLDIDTRADIYALGAMLYELLTGSTPLDRKRLHSAAFAEMLRMIKEEEPPEPSTRLTQSKDSLASLAVQRRIEPAKLAKAVRGELDWIVMKCLEKDRTRRYDTANSLARDVERYLHDEPVEACPPSAGYRLRKFTRRYRTPMIVAVAFTVLLVAGVVVSTWQAVRATWAEGEAVLQRDLAAQEATKARALSLQAEERREEAQSAKKDVERQRDDGRMRLYVSHMNLAKQTWDDAHIGRMLSLLEGQKPEQTGNQDLRGFEWHYLWRLCHSDLRTLRGHEQAVTCVAFHPNGQRLASASLDKTVRIWETATGRELLCFQAHAQGVNCVAFSPNGRRLATAAGEAWAQGIPVGTRPKVGGEVKVWDAITGKELLSIHGHSDTVWSVAFSPDGQRLASGSEDSMVKIWDAQTGRELLCLKAHVGEVKGVAFSPNGRYLASAGYDNTETVSTGYDKTVRIWDAGTGRELLVLRAVYPYGVAFSADSQRVAAAGWDKTVRVWELPSGKEALILRGHAADVYKVAFSPDSKRIASASSDQTVRVWDAKTGDELLSFKGHTSGVSCVVFSPDGRRLASSSGDRTVKLWDAGIDQECVTLKGHLYRVWQTAFTADGKQIVSTGADETVKVWDADTGQELLTFPGGPFCVAVSPDGQRVAFEGMAEIVRVVDIGTGKPVRTLKGHTDQVYGMAFSPDGQRLASAAADRTVRIWNAASGSQFLLLEHTFPVSSVAFSPDGRHLAAAGGSALRSERQRPAELKVWDVFSGQLVHSLAGHQGEFVDTAFSPDGRLLASAGADGLIKVWEVSTGRERFTVTGHKGWVRAVAFSPDGRRLASAGYDQTVKLWDMTTGQEVLTLKGHDRSVWCVAFSPDGQRIVSGSTDATLKVWDARPLTPALWSEREGNSLLQSLLGQGLSKEEITARIRQDATASEAVKTCALQRLEVSWERAVRRAARSVTEYFLLAAPFLCR